MEPYIDFQKKLGISFNDISVLQQAFIHRSYINENKDSGLEHNERLEFLGDAVLELVVTDFLYRKYQDVDEGVLTAYRSSLVRTESISQAARDLGMNELLLLSKGESRDEGKARNYILANTFEALIGAIYLDCGYQSAHDVIATSLFDNITQVIADGSWKDAKSRFQEYAQEQYGHTPEYILESAKGPDHDKLFTIAVVVGDKKMAVGKGRSKQKAQQNAAAKALESVGDASDATSE
jgi:ribonuclease-3